MSKQALSSLCLTIKALDLKVELKDYFLLSGINTSKTKPFCIITGVIALLAVVLTGSSFYVVKRRRQIEKDGNGKSQQIKLLSMEGETLDNFGL
ncbi:hypothetical protein P3S68_019521 [Capsicum galapagoense]